MSALPPVAVRRVVIAPLGVALAVAAAVISAPLLAVSAGVRAVRPRCCHALRAVTYTTLYVAHEGVMLAVLLGLWIAAGCGRRLRTERWQRRHYDVLRMFLGSLRRWAARVLGVRVEVEDSAEAESALRGCSGPVLVFSRHDGPGDSFFLVEALLSRYHRHPRIVLREALQLDPCVDLVCTRLPSCFVPSGPRREEAAGRIADLARGLDDRGALLLFPEGGNATAERRRRAVARLRRQGRGDDAARAAGLRHLVAPRPGGVTAAIDAAPDAAVVFVAHSGLSGMGGSGGLVARTPMDRRLRTRMWLVPPAEVAAAEDRTAWLFDWWVRMDAWVDTLPAPAVAGTPPVRR
jgi:Acyltransferase